MTTPNPLSPEELARCRAEAKRLYPDSYGINRLLQRKAFELGAAWSAAQAQGVDVSPMNALKADDVEWVVNDIAELGVKIGNQFFWLYKGTSLQYDGLHDEDENGHRKPMRWRHVYKREFGECCHPIETLKAHGRKTLDDFPNAYGDSDDWKDIPLPTPPEQPSSGEEG